jgi:hypothetical protein
VQVGIGVGYARALIGVGLSMCMCHSLSLPCTLFLSFCYSFCAYPLPPSPLSYSHTPCVLASTCSYNGPAPAARGGGRGRAGISDAALFRQISAAIQEQLKQDAAAARAVAVRSSPPQQRGAMKQHQREIETSAPWGGGGEGTGVDGDREATGQVGGEARGGVEGEAAGERERDGERGAPAPLPYSSLHSQPSFDSQSISNVINAFAKQGMRDPALFAALATAALALPPAAFSPQVCVRVFVCVCVCVCVCVRAYMRV